PGPIIVLRGTLPNVPAAGSEKQPGSKYVSTPPSTGLSEQPATRSGVWPAPPERGSARARSKPSCGVNGMPDRTVTMLESCHPLAIARAAAESEEPVGISHVALNEKWCRMSKSDSPL